TARVFGRDGDGLEAAMPAIAQHFGRLPAPVLAPVLDDDVLVAHHEDVLQRDEVAGIRDDLDQFGAPAALGGMWFVTRVERRGLVERETHAELASHREDAPAI